MSATTETLFQQTLTLFNEGRHESAYALFQSDPDAIDNGFEAFYSAMLKVKAANAINSRNVGGDTLG